MQSVGMAPKPETSTDAKDGKLKEKTEVREPPRNHLDPGALTLMGALA